MGIFLEPAPEPTFALAEPGRNFLQDVEVGAGKPISHRWMRGLSAGAVISSGGGIYCIVVCRGGRRDDSGWFDPADSLASGWHGCRRGLVIISRLAGVIGGHNHTLSACDVGGMADCCGQPKKSPITELRDIVPSTLTVIVSNHTGHILPSYSSSILWNLF
jgi:hypothetical protein